VPLIVSWPGVTRAGPCAMSGRFHGSLLHLLAMAGLPPGDGLPPTDRIWPAVGDLSRTCRAKPVLHYRHYYSTTSPVGAIRAGDWKLLEFYEDHTRNCIICVTI